MNAATGVEAGDSDHCALFYDGPADYTRGVGEFLAAGLAAGEPILVAVPGPRLDLLRADLPADGDVTFVDMVEFGANPARNLSALREFTDARPGRRTWLVAEPIWPGRSAAETVEATRTEALVDLAFIGVPISILCPYDVEGLAAGVVRDASRTHQVVARGGERRRSASYEGSVLADVIAARPLPAPPAAGATALGFGDPGDLVAVRRHVREQASRHGLPGDRAQQLVIAVNELVTNALRHGRGPGGLRVWRDRTAVVCEISGPGRIEDPLAGRRPRDASPDGPHGLWLVNRLCDLTEQRTAPTGTIVRVHVRLHRHVP